MNTQSLLNNISTALESKDLAEMKMRLCLMESELMAEAMAGPDATIIEQCAKIADPWPGFNVGQKISEPDLSVIEVRNKIAAAIRALSTAKASE